ncbi:hypothetical protein BVC80_1043g2 [Macleaya cordata]|uniref:Uncharacterized protein n=1 Tax=Macleaya cordata TaxID=56857 RepID=A0A200QZ12_MACCD|nr:hypothetical protein BVC80_1043g2 [Macleaya cordata]
MHCKTIGHASGGCKSRSEDAKESDPARGRSRGRSREKSKQSYEAKAAQPAEAINSLKNTTKDTNIANEVVLETSPINQNLLHDLGILSNRWADTAELEDEELPQLLPHVSKSQKKKLRQQKAKSLREEPYPIRSRIDNPSSVI